MSKLSTVFVLIHTLSKGEKRFFKLNSALQSGTKDYLVLFDIIEKNTDLQQITKTFKKKRPKASIEVATKYLYKVITDCLLWVRSDQHLENKLVTGVLKANILLEKSLYEEGFRQLNKMIEMADKFEQPWIELWACKLELFYLTNLNFYSLSEKELLNKQIRIDALLKYAGNLQQHSSLYELLRHRLLYKGNVRTARQKEQLNDLVVSEMNILANSLEETVESQKTHLLFQAHYFMCVSDYRSALATFNELIELLEANSFLWIDKPVEYLTTIEGILDTLRTTRQYSNMKFFVNKIKALSKPTAYFEVMANRVLFLYELFSLIDTGRFIQAEAVKEKFEQSLLKKLHLLDIGKQADVYMSVAVIYIGTGNIRKALFYLNKVLMHNKVFFTLPVYRTFRLLNLVVHFELENFDYITYEIRSIKRALNLSGIKAYGLEKMIFKFIEHAGRINYKPGPGAFEKFTKDVQVVKADKYSIQILKTFDFIKWVEAKITKRSFSAVLQEA